MPFYSVDTNQQIIVAGTNEDIIFWDIRNLKSPLEVLDESHSEDVTCVRFHPEDYHQVITCSTDCLVNFFNFEGKKSMKEEDDVLEGTYCCTQPLLDCGFIPGS
jgi:WD40 repeat protein